MIGARRGLSLLEPHLVSWTPLHGQTAVHIHAAARVCCLYSLSFNSRTGLNLFSNRIDLSDLFHVIRCFDAEAVKSDVYRAKFQAGLRGSTNDTLSFLPDHLTCALSLPSQHPILYFASIFFSLHSRCLVPPISTMTSFVLRPLPVSRSARRRPWRNINNSVSSFEAVFCV